MLKRIAKIESYGFECIAGPLELCVDWIELKDNVKNLLAEVERLQEDKDLVVNVWCKKLQDQLQAAQIFAAPSLLKVAQKLLLWMEECDLAIEFNHDDLALYDELRQVIRTAGGFSSETHWWQGPCICSACGHAWQGVVEIPIESTYPQVPLECSECHQMTGGPA